MNKQQNIYKKIINFLYILSFLSLIIFFISIFLHNITSFTQDLGRHLKIGQLIVENLIVPKTNLFSYTNPNFYFLNHHWLPEVFFYLIASFIGLNSLIVVKTIFFFAAFFILFWLVKKNNGWFMALTSGFLVLLLFSQRTEIRPEIFSYMFLSIYLVVLSNKKIFTKFFYILPIIQLLWVNSHIYFIIGPVLLFLYLIGQLFSLKSKKTTKLVKPTVIFLLSSAVNIINPNFIKGALYPLFVFKNYGYQIVENQSFVFMSKYVGKIYHPYFLFVFSLTFLTFLLTLEKQNIFSIISFIFFSYLGFSAIRNIPIFALSIFLPIARNLKIIQDKFFAKISLNFKVNLILLFFFIFIPTLLLQAFQNITNRSRIYKYSPKRFGFGKIDNLSNGVNFIISNKINGPLFNNFDIGSFLIYKLYPEYKVFIDGRPEAYPADFLQNTYIPMQMDEKIWQEMEKKWQFNFIFFSHTDITPWATAFLPKIINDNNWQLVFLDDFSIIFVKNIEQNKKIVEKYAIDKGNFEFDCQSKVDCYGRMLRILKMLNISQVGLKL